MKNNDDVLDAPSFLTSTCTDAFLVSNHFNILYLSGFEGLSVTEREAFIFITKKGSYFITDGRYEEEGNISPLYKRCIIDTDHSVSSYVQSICLEEGIRTIGFEANDLSWKEVELFSKMPVTFSPHIDAFKEMREQKNKEELESLFAACSLGDKAFKELIPFVKPGKSEQEIAWTLESIIRKEYKAEIAFDPIVASGANAAIPHYNTKRGRGTVARGSLLLIDFGVKWQNYCSDMTRMIAVGEIESGIQNAYAVLEHVQEKTKKEIKKCNHLSDIDLFCREMLIKRGFNSYPHSTGHGVGLEIHEGPKVSAISKDVKKENHVFTVEPGIYVSQKWGMRLEDVVSITSSGGSQDLTRFSRELIRV